MLGGYYFAMYLPGATGFVPEGASRHAVAPDPDAAAEAWCCYAWPVSHGVSGVRVFCVDKSGDIVASDNEGPGPRFSALGTGRPITSRLAGIAFRGGTMEGGLARNANGHNGTWWNWVE